ncbi:general secretion pathway protein H [Hephaestia caeni]|uniref:Type II secretion system protein H n=1 Tax=Hephaestia caeni TaxID=645617 RepID=A0A397P9U6_9SPHN|nr:GspH/FimT family pseudopilin [Hephaestia caeni]RIA46320.1 general secretion pathway protein H [Hephaestia caeni]
MWGAGKKSCSRYRAQAGFTLLEALVILAILALIAGVAFPAVGSALRYQAFADGATRFEASLRGARAQALRRGAAVRFLVSPDRRAFALGDAVDRLPDELRGVAPDGGVTFFPDGTATGGEVAVVDRVRERRWRVRATTGEIERVL